jgi:hypothetical protein
MATYDDLAPDAHSPVRVDGRIFGVQGGLHCIDTRQGLESRWVATAPEFNEYVSLIAGADRLLALTLRCELLLIDARADEYRLLDRLALCHDGTETLAHPALLGSRLLVRTGPELICLELDPASP